MVSDLSSDRLSCRLSQPKMRPQIQLPHTLADDCKPPSAGPLGNRPIYCVDKFVLHLQHEFVQHPRAQYAQTNREFSHPPSTGIK
jgi:hypothetical protein